MDKNTNIPVICPQCGAHQEVDATQDAAICRYCGKPFAIQTAVSAYNDRYGEQTTYASPGPTYSPEPKKPRKKRIFWWIIGWVFCFPIPLTILVARSNRLGGWVKAVIIAAAWIVYLLLGARYRASTADRTPKTERTPAIVETTATPRPTTRPTPIPTAKPTPTPEPVEEEPEYRWEEDDAGWRYRDSNGEPMTGWVQDQGVWYHLDENGVMQTGWLDVDGYWYYLKESGAMAENESLTIEGEAYSFDEDGHLIEETPTPALEGVTPEFKAAMDSYEAFFDEYCEFMKAMNDDPTDFTMLLKYADMMSRYADTMEKLDAIDEDELSLADDAYYIEVMARINVKLLEAANYMN